MILDLGVMSSSPTLGAEIIKNKTKQNKTLTMQIKLKAPLPPLCVLINYLLQEGKCYFDDIIFPIL